MTVPSFTAGVRLWIAALLLALAVPVHATVTGLKLENLNGRKQAMSDYIGKGHWVIVNVWSPTCDFCVRELPNVERLYARHKDEGLIVLGVTLDYPSFGYGRIKIIRSFLSRHPLDYPIFLADLDLASKLIGHRLVGIPLTAIFHPDGRVLARWPGNINVREIEDFMKHYKKYTDGWILDQ